MVLWVLMASRRLRRVLVRVMRMMVMLLGVFLGCAGVPAVQAPAAQAAPLPASDAVKPVAPDAPAADAPQAKASPAAAMGSAAVPAAPATATLPVIPPRDAPPLDERLGTWHRAIVTSVPLAQQYFDQGLRLLYAFNQDEAGAAFKAATELDPRCAMCFWGEAMVLGPNINVATDPDREKQAALIVQQARVAASSTNAVEREWVEAIAVRYRANPSGERKAQDEAYAQAMRGIMQRHPDDVDAKVLFAEAMLDLRPWAQWTKDGKAEPGTDELVAALEAALKQAPEHPGANHFYIHAVEASAHPERALTAAARLPGLMPGAGHLVHMPSHVFIRTGQYAAGSEANEKAIAVDEESFRRRPPASMVSRMYAQHNYDFLWVTAALEGRKAKALWAVDKLAELMPTSTLLSMMKDSGMAGMDYGAGSWWVARVWFGEWKAILDAPWPPKELPALQAVSWFARGMANVRTQKVRSAAEDLALLTAYAKKLPESELLTPTAHAKVVFEAMQLLLRGEIDMDVAESTRALSELRQAVVMQDSLPYDEPPVFALPARLYLGAALLHEKKAKEAEAVYRDELQRQPESGQALFGLMQALRAQKTKAAQLEAEKVFARFEKAYARADVTLTSSRF
ncbi:MAG: hypothetical protein JST92_02750 [Deltaproteobacteria bacterium]|nr:hypothetical protein [Deltaproteobacteria bacterium]